MIPDRPGSIVPIRSSSLATVRGRRRCRCCVSRSRRTSRFASTPAGGEARDRVRQQVRAEAEAEFASPSRNRARPSRGGRCGLRGFFLQEKHARGTRRTVRGDRRRRGMPSPSRSYRSQVYRLRYHDALRIRRFPAAEHRTGAIPGAAMHFWTHERRFNPDLANGSGGRLRRRLRRR